MFEDLSQGTLLVAAMVGVIMWIMIMVKIQSAKLVIVAMLFMSAIGVALNFRGGYLGSWLLPLQLQRANLFLALGVLLLLSFMGVAGKVSIARTSFQAWMLLTIALYQGFLRVFHDTAIDGAMSMAFAMGTIFPLMLIFPALLREKEDWYALLRVIMWASMLYLGGCLVQMAINPTKLIIPGLYRFYGISANPIFASTYLAVPAVVGLWLILNDPKWRYRWLWIALFGLNLILMLATGSRSGIVYTIIGFVAVLYRRLGRSVLILPFIALSAWVALEFVSLFGINFGFSRVVSLEDTRSAAWLILIEEGLQSPLFGHGTTGVSKSENSYLFGFASFGLPMLALMLVFLFASISHCKTLQRTVRSYPSWRPLVDLMIGFNVIYFANTMLDGIILARTDPQLINMLLFSAMSAMFMLKVRNGELADEVEEEVDHAHYEGAGDDWDREALGTAEPT